MVSTIAVSSSVDCAECLSMVAFKAFIEKRQKAKPDKPLLSLLSTSMSGEYPCDTISKQDLLEQLSLASTAETDTCDRDSFDDLLSSISSDAESSTSTKGSEKDIENGTSSYISLRDLNRQEKAKAEIRIAKHDLFEKQKAKAQKSQKAKVVTVENAPLKEHIREQMIPETTKAYPVEGEAQTHEIRISKDDLFGQQKARVFSLKSNASTTEAAGEIEIANDDLFQVPTSAMEKVSVTWPNEIKIAKDDVFQKQKGRAQTFAMAKAITDDARASAIMNEHLVQKEKTQLQTFKTSKVIDASANELTIAKDDFFEKEKGRAQPNSSTKSMTVEVSTSASSQPKHEADTDHEKVKALLLDALDQSTLEAASRESVIRIAKDDIFQTANARHLASAKTEAISAEPGTKDSPAAHQAPKSFPVSQQGVLAEIKVANGDLFQKARGRAYATGMPFKSLMSTLAVLPSPEQGRYSEFQ